MYNNIFVEKLCSVCCRFYSWTS